MTNMYEEITKEQEKYIKQLVKLISNAKTYNIKIALNIDDRTLELYNHNSFTEAFHNDEELQEPYSVISLY